MPVLCGPPSRKISQPFSHPADESRSNPRKGRDGTARIDFHVVGRSGERTGKREFSVVSPRKLLRQTQRRSSRIVDSLAWSGRLCNRACDRSWRPGNVACGASLLRITKRPHRLLRHELCLYDRQQLLAVPHRASEVGESNACGGERFFCFRVCLYPHPHAGIAPALIRFRHCVHANCGVSVGGYIFGRSSQSLLRDAIRRQTRVANLVQ